MDYGGDRMQKIEEICHWCFEDEGENGVEVGQIDEEQEESDERTPESEI